MADPERTRSLLEAAGFEVRRMENVAMTWPLEEFDGYGSLLTSQVDMVAVTIAGLAEDDERAYAGASTRPLSPTAGTAATRFRAPR